MDFPAPGERLTEEQKAEFLKWRQGRLTFLEALSLVKGIMPESREVLARRDQLAEELSGRPQQDWPAFDLRWDLDPERFYRALDGETRDTFAATHGDLRVWWVDVEELYRAVDPTSRRDAKELWARKFRDKNAKALAFWVDGGEMTPAMIVLVEGGLCICGGNHRMAVARAKGARYVPVLISDGHLDAVRSSIQLHLEQPTVPG